MIDKLSLEGNLTGTYNGKDFRLEMKGKSGKFYFTSVDTLKVLKDAFFEKLKQHKNDPEMKKFLEEVDYEIYLNDELILRIGKNAKSNFVSSMLGIKHLEVVSNSQMSDLMSLM